jgi:hypothetical protein
MMDADRGYIGTDVDGFASAGRRRRTPMSAPRPRVGVDPREKERE